MFGRRTTLQTVARTAKSKPPNFFQFPSSSTSSSSSSFTSTSRKSPDDKNNDGCVCLSSEGSTCNGGLPTNVNSGFSVNNWSAASACLDEEFELVSADESEGTRHGVSMDHVFGPVPSAEEVQHVVSAIEKFFDSSSQLRDKFSGKDLVYRISSPTASESSSLSSSWIEPDYSRGMLQSYGPNRVYDALHLLQTDPSVQRVVSSLSSDKNVWNSILNNEVVKELRYSYYTGEDKKPFSYTDSSESSTEKEDESSEVTNIVEWILVNTMDLFEKITSFMSGLFNLSAMDASPKSAGGGLLEQAGAGAGAGGDVFEQRLRTSFMLSIFVMLVVVLARTNLTT